MNDGNGTGHDGSFAIYHNTSGQLGMWIGANGSGYGFGLLTITGGLSGSWMHFAVSVNGSTATVYKNGSSAGTISLTPHSTAGILTLIIGRLGHFNAYYFKGDLDQMRYFNKAISETEVGELYAETACVYTATTTNNNYPTTNAAYYKLDNSAEDEKGSYDGVETDIEYKFGRFGQAAVLNGSSSLMTITDGGIGANGTARVSFSVSLWIKTTASNQSAIISDFGSNYGFYIQMESSASGGAGKLSIANYYTGGLVYTTAGTVAINDGNWHHLVLVNKTSDNTQKLYLDGNTTPVISQTLGSGTKTANAIQVGYYTGYVGTYNFDGNIDQIRLFSSALSDSQVTQLYNEKQAYITKSASDPFGDSSEVSFYKMENNANDSTGSNNGSASNVTFSTTDALFDSYSAVFNGSSSIISIPQPTLSGGFTLSAWFKTTSSAFQSVITMGGSSAAAGLNIFTNSGNVITSFGNGSSEDYNAPTSSVTVNTGAWFHVALSTSGLSSGSTVKLYINGQLDDSELSSANINTTSYTSAFSIGGRNLSGSLSTYFNGDIDQVRIFNRALEGDEVFKLYAEVIN